MISNSTVPAMRRLAGIFIVTTWCAGATAAQAPLEGLDAAIEASRIQWHVPGLAVAIVKDDKVVFARGYGVRELGKPARVDTHSLFTLASTTKAFVATAAAILVDEGKLHWDDPVIGRIPEFRVADPYVTREVTLRDLLAHRTGIEATDVLWVRGFDFPTSLSHLQYAEQASSLRSAWGYNNEMYMVSGEVVARAAGKPLPEFIEERIFVPLGMKESTFTSADLVKRDNVAGAHLIEHGVARRIEPYRSQAPLGAAGVQSSVTDMAQWLRMLLNEGKVNGAAVVKAETLAETWKPQMILSSITYPAAVQAKPHFFAYGLGWFLQDYKGRLLAMHTGSLYGANALVAMVPEERLGLVILVNAETVEYRHAFMYDVVDRFTGNRGKDWSGDLLKRVAKEQAESDRQREQALAARPRDAKPSLPLSAYTGIYSNPVSGDTEIVEADGKLALVMKPEARFALAHWAYDTFEASEDRAPEEERFLLTFARTVDGKISGFETAGGKRYRRK
jgi:CubicO group peptidase (beta-lactamase class C family)